MINTKERAHLRALAARQAELAQSPLNLSRVEEWKLHNAGKGKRPMVHIELDTFEQEALEPMLTCGDAQARRLERDLLRGTLNLTEFDDDWVVPGYFGVEWESYFHLFGHDITQTTAVDFKGNSVGHQFNYVISSLEDDRDKLGKTVFGIDKEASISYKQLADDVFGDILPVRMTMASLGAVPTQLIVHMMGMETMFLEMYDSPDLFKAMMSRVADDYRDYFDFLEAGGFLLPTTGFELLKQGSKCFTDELPSGNVTATTQVWGFMDSQESVGLSPEMYGKFVFPCYKRIAESFGLLSYGCCEPVSAVWEYVKTLPNLRKVSVSPWCDQAFMGEQLRGGNIIFHRKPSPNYLGVDEKLDEPAFRAHIRETAVAARGCPLEITQRDVYTVHHNLGKVRRAVEIIREELETVWR